MKSLPKLSFDSPGQRPAVLFRVVDNRYGGMSDCRGARLTADVVLVRPVPATAGWEVRNAGRTPLDSLRLTGYVDANARGVWAFGDAPEYVERHAFNLRELTDGARYLGAVCARMDAMRAVEGMPASYGNQLLRFARAIAPDGKGIVLLYVDGQSASRYDDASYHVFGWPGARPLGDALWYVGKAIEEWIAKHRTDLPAPSQAVA